MQSYTPEQRRSYNGWLNAVSRLTYQIAGCSERAFYALPRGQRLAVRETAKQLHDLGVDFATAQRAEKTDRRGFVYVITNPAWPDAVKIGRAFDPESRLNGYQTSSPARDFELAHAVYFADCHLAEREIHLRLGIARLNGEWFHLSVAAAAYAINQLRETL